MVLTDSICWANGLLPLTLEWEYIIEKAMAPPIDIAILPQLKCNYLLHNPCEDAFDGMVNRM